MDDIYEEIASTFSVKNISWNIDGQSRVPSREDIQAAAQKMRARLADEPDGSTITMGHLLVQKLNGKYDLYLYLGLVQDVLH